MNKTSLVKIRKISHGTLAIIFLSVLIFPNFISRSLPWRGSDTASLTLYSSTDQPSIGQTFFITMHLKSGRHAVNAIESHLRFNPYFLEIIKMTTEKSFCSFYMENSFDNNQGKVDLACGSPNPGFQGESTIISLTMRSKAIGPTQIEANPKEAWVMANDGKGRNILTTPPSLNLNINNSF